MRHFDYINVHDFGTKIDFFLIHKYSLTRPYCFIPDFHFLSKKWKIEKNNYYAQTVSVIFGNYGTGLIYPAVLYQFQAKFFEQVFSC